MVINKSIIAIILIGFLLRVWGINFGLPYHHIIDEQELIYSAFYSGDNALSPLRYLDPPLTQYILLFEYAIYYLIGGFENIATFFVSYLRDPSAFLLIGRLTMAIVGTMSIWVLWRMGEKFFDKNVGILSALFLSFNFIHSKESHYIKQDVLSTLFILIAFYFTLAILKSHRKKDYILSGIFSGVAIATKFQTALFLPVFILTQLLIKKGKILKNLLLFIFSLVAAHIMVNPYTILDFKGTLSGLIREYPVTQDIYPSQMGRPIWLFYLTEHIPEGIGWLMMIISFAGFAICFIKGKREINYLLVPILPVLFLFTVSYWTKWHLYIY